MEDDERGDDEEHHRGQRVPRPELEAEILPRQRGNVGQVVRQARSSSSRAEASGASRSGSWVETTTV